MKIIICGGRDYNDYDYAFEQLDALHQLWGGITEVIEGGAKGADRIGRRWAQMRHIKVTTVEANWNTEGKAAGYKRNVRMAGLNPDRVIAFPGGKGTEHMKRIAHAHNIPVIIR